LLAPYNLEPRKNLSQFLLATAKLRNSGVRFQVILFGRAAVNEARETEYQWELCRLGLNLRTKLTGPISDEQLSRLDRRAAVFVYPS
jgi:glycosyltransferase involved in cell wall biosynthesis